MITKKERKIMAKAIPPFDYKTLKCYAPNQYLMGSDFFETLYAAHCDGDIESTEILIHILLREKSDEADKLALPYMEYLHKLDIHVWDYDIALFYEEGRIAPKDKSKALEYYLFVANPPFDDVQSMSKVGYFYHNGIGTKKSIKNAIEWYMKASNKGDDYSNLALGVIYARGENAGKIDKKKAVHYLKKAKKSENKEIKETAMEWLVHIQKVTLNRRIENDNDND